MHGAGDESQCGVNRKWPKKKRKEAKINTENMAGERYTWQARLG